MPGRPLTREQLETRLHYATKLGFRDDAEHWQAELDKLNEQDKFKNGS